jgi:hypothetical protein
MNESLTQLSVSDRDYIGGSIYFEIDVRELTSHDLAKLKRKPSREVVRVKLYDDNRDIPICLWTSEKVNQYALHPTLQSQAYCLCPHEDGYIALFRAVIPQHINFDDETLDHLVDEIRPTLLFQIGEDNNMSIVEVIKKIHDIQFHFALH